MAMSETEPPIRVTTLSTERVLTPKLSLSPTKRPEQKPLSVTLSGSVLTSTVVGTAIFLRPETLYLARIVLLLTPPVLFIYNDYLNFLRLGPGGIPSTPRGYLKVSLLRLGALRNPLEPPAVKPEHPSPSLGILRAKPLPIRSDPRPTTAGIAPHRQINQYGTTECFQALRRVITSFAAADPAAFETKTSCLEKYGLALFARRPAGDRQSRFDGEICHVHDADHSLHLFLHPDDIREVLDKGWGERHPLAWEWGPVKMPVGPFFVMIYAPRNEHEVRTVVKIIEAAAWNATGSEIQLSPYLSAL